jgi:apolipoprotein D and lipocalin family protein
MTLHRATLPIAFATGVALAVGAATTLRREPGRNRAVPQPHKAVDLARYAGLWHEIGRYENGFERGLEGVTAEYRIREDGQVQVINTGHKGGPNGEAKVSVGRAKTLPNTGDAKLKVSFFGPFFLGDYWVLDHDLDYSWSVVGEPSGRFLWLLARDAKPTSVVRDILFARARELGYDTTRIRTTLQ